MLIRRDAAARTFCQQRRDPETPHHAVSGEHPYEIAITTTAARDLQRLPETVATACVEFIFGPLIQRAAATTA
jgi:hypothetical protein